MGELDDVLGTVEKLHAASLEPQLWPEALRAVARVVSGAWATLELFDRQSLDHRFFEGVGGPPEAGQLYIEQYSRQNPRLPAALRQPAGSVIWDRQFVDETTMDGLPWYAEYLSMFEMRYHFAGVLRTASAELGVLTVQRSVRQSDVVDHDVALMRTLLPHAGQALEVAMRLRRSALSISSEGAADWLTDGLLVLTAAGVVRQANSAARAIARRGDGVAIVRGGLRFSDAEAQRRLGRGLRAIADVRHARLDASVALDFTASRGDGAPPYVASLRPIGGVGSQSEAALLFLRDPLNDGVAVGALMEQAFGFTPAEAHLAQALCRGMSPKAYARGNGVSINTVYTHLAHIKDKCRQSRISEVVRVLSRIRPAAASASPA